MQSGLLTGHRPDRGYADHDVVDEIPAHTVITPEGDEETGVLIKAPSHGWSMRGGSGLGGGGTVQSQPYGLGQAIVLMAADDRFASDMTEPIQRRRLRFRLDAWGGLGLGGGMHVATGRNMPFKGAWGSSATQHMWVDGAYGDSIALVHNQYPASSAPAALQLSNSASQALTVIDASQNFLLKAPDGVGRSIGTASNSGATTCAMTASDGGLFGVRMQSSAISPGTIALLSAAAASQTADVTRQHSSTGQVMFHSDSVFNNVVLAPDSIARSLGTASNSGAAASVLAASDGGFTGARAILWTIVPTTIGLGTVLAASQTAEAQTVSNSSNQVLTSIDSAGSRLLKSPDSVARVFRTQDASGNDLFTTAAGGGIASVQTTIKSRTASVAPLVVMHAASPTTEMTSWQSSTGAKLSASDAIASHWVGSPDAVARTVRTIDGSGNDAAALYAGPGAFGARSIFNSRGTALIPIFTQGVASQTSDLQEWANSAAQVLIKADSGGAFQSMAPDSVSRGFRTNDGSGTALAQLLGYQGSFGVQNIFTAGLPGCDVVDSKGAASQTATLYKALDSASAVLLSVLASGQLKTAAANEATGAGSAALGANSPAVTNTAPYKWLKFTTSDGSQCYVPAWK